MARPIFQSWDHMKSRSDRKWREYRKRVILALQELLNDPAIMPNADCPEIVVIVNDVSFGKTVGTIFVDLSAHFKDPERWKTAHDQYTRESEANGNEGVYDDIDDLTMLPHNIALIERELQRKLKLTYQPILYFEKAIGLSGEMSAETLVIYLSMMKFNNRERGFVNQNPSP